jgi:multidrug efflux pump subunit AcrA (membrane-fusion protein)
MAKEDGDKGPEKTSKNENEGANVDIKTKRALYEKEQELEQAQQEKEALKKELDAVKKEAEKRKASLPDAETLRNLQNQLNLLQQQVVGHRTADGRLNFRPPTPDDLVEKDQEVTFIARTVFYVVGSYKDATGIEVYPPHKIIVFTYASSDIRKEGRETDILNFSTYTTNLKTEIEFLRNSPYYGIAFSENTNEMAKEDTYETQYKIRAATMLQGLAPEQIYTRAEFYKIPNWRSKPVDQLRYLIVNAMAKEYRADAEALQKDIEKRRVVHAPSSEEVETE